MSSPFVKPIREDKDIEDIRSIINSRKQKKESFFEPEPEKDIVKKTVKPEIKVEKPKGEKLSDKQVKKLRLRLKKRSVDYTKIVVFTSVLGIIGIVFFYQMIEKVNPMLAVILALFGMLCFLPLGVIVGWLFMDPYMRCKLMRRFRGKNYGIVNFVHKGGNRIDQRIKNLDDDVVVQGTKLWVLHNSGIYYVDKENNKVLSSEVDPKAMVTLPNNVPMLSLDAESMLPLRYHEEKTKTNPQQVGAVALGYINNQIAKNLFFKKQMTFFYVTILALQAMNICGLIILYDELVGL